MTNKFCDQSWRSLVRGPTLGPVSIRHWWRHHATRTARVAIDSQILRIGRLECTWRARMTDITTASPSTANMANSARYTIWREASFFGKSHCESARAIAPSCIVVAPIIEIMTLVSMMRSLL
jgi:hypothetical protein